MLPCELRSNADCIFAALGHSRFIHEADRLWASVVFGDELLASIPQFFFIALDRFQKPL